MSTDIQRIVESKRAYRRAMAQRPVAEKLALLDKLRDRTVAIRAASSRQKTTVVRESPPEYHNKPEKD